MTIFASVSSFVNCLRNYTFCFQLFLEYQEALGPPGILAPLWFPGKLFIVSLNKMHRLPAQVSQKLTSWFSHRGLSDHLGVGN